MSVSTYRFPRCSIIFLYRDLAATVRSFMSVMTAVRRVAAILGDSDQMMDWWCRDLPLPQPPTQYAWATDTVFLVSNQSLLSLSFLSFRGGGDFFPFHFILFLKPSLTKVNKYIVFNLKK